MSENVHVSRGWRPPDILINLIKTISNGLCCFIISIHSVHKRSVFLLFYLFVLCTIKNLICLQFAVPAVGRCLLRIETRGESSTAVQNFRSILQKQLNDIHAAGTYKNERVITSPQDTVINIEGSSRSVLNFCANNYLGMSVCETIRCKIFDLI